MKRLSKLLTIALAVALAAILCLKQGKISDYIPHHPLGAFFVIMLLYAVKCFVPVLPVAVLYIASGSIFPWYLAIPVNAAGCALCMTIPYFAGRANKQRALEMLKKHPRLQKSLPGGTNGFFISYFLRVINFLPLDLVSLYLGAKGLGFCAFFAGSMLGNLPGMTAITLMGHSATNPLSPEFISSAGVSLALTVLSLALYRINSYPEGAGKNR